MNNHSELSVPSVKPLPEPKFRFTKLQKQRPDLTVAQIINSNNYSEDEIANGLVKLESSPAIPESADIVVAGAGIASLMYALHIKKLMPEASVVILEKSSAPTYKIGESTLSPFSRFSQSHILPIPYMLRLFNLKEGLDFALLDPNGTDVHYQDIGGLDFSFQLERKVSELLLTLKAQRLGVKIFYGVGVDGSESDLASKDFKTISFIFSPSVITNSSIPTKSVKAEVKVAMTNKAKRQSMGLKFSLDSRRATPVDRDIESPKESSGKGFLSKIFNWARNNHERPSSPDINFEQNEKFNKRSSQIQSRTILFDATAAVAAIAPPVVAKPMQIKAKIVGDGTGIAKTLARKEATTEKFDGINFTSYWAYFKEDMNIPEKIIQDWTYPATNHLCIAEGWSWWIRLISWESTERPLLMDYITYLLDLYDAGVPGNQIPSIGSLCKTFDCTYEYIVSVGFVVRDDTLDNFHPPGKTDGKTMFWGIIEKYPVAEKVLKSSGRYTLLEKYYGPTLGTYFTRKSMSYRQTCVAGDSWFAFGNSAGFTSPLFSPGINCIGLPFSYLAAELSVNQLKTGESGKEEFQAFAEKHIEGLRTVDLILYNMFRDPRFFMNVFQVYYSNGLAKV
ncbi:hypothetical protein HK096_003638, partial [Nowakowskiella sp. JEL0078]